MARKDRIFQGMRKRYTGKSELVYSEIRDAIMKGVLKPGDKLVTDQLAEDFNVSRMPVREAINRLAFEGFVRVVPHKEVTVSEVSLEKFKDVIAVRSLTEGYAARMAAACIDEKDVKHLRGIYAKMEKATEQGNTEKLITFNREFHMAIVNLLGNQVLSTIVGNLFDSFQRFGLYTLSSRDDSFELLREHHELIDLLASHDTEGAETVMRRHVEHRRLSDESEAG